MTQSKTAGKTSVITVCILASFMPPFMAASLTVALPSIGRVFSMPAVDLSWLITSYLLSIAVFLVPFGKAGDMYGRRNIFIGGTIVFSLTSLVSAIAPTAGVLILFRVLQGIGGAMIFATYTAMLTNAAEPKERGRLLGLSVSSTYLGLSLGPTIGGFFTQAWGWRSVFLVNVPVGVLILYLMFAHVSRENPGPVRERFDFTGSALYGLSLVSLMCGLTKIPGTIGYFLCAAGIAGFLLFIRFESGLKTPVLRLSIFKGNSVFAYSNLAALLNYSAANGAGFMISLYLQFVKGYPPRYAGIVLITQPLLMAVFSPLAGRLSDKIEPRIVASAGMVLTACSLFLFSFLTPATPLPLVVSGLALLGIGVTFFSSPNTSAIMSSVDQPQYGIASSIVGTMRLLGQVFSLGIAALTLSVFLGNAPITPEHFRPFMKSVRWSYTVFAVLCTLGVAASLARGNIKRD